MFSLCLILDFFLNIFIFNILKVEVHGLFEGAGYSRKYGTSLKWFNSV